MIRPKCVSRQGRWEVSTHVSNLFMLANTQCWYDPGAGVGWRYCPVTTRISLTINIQYTHPVIPAEIMYWQEFYKYHQLNFISTFTRHWRHNIILQWRTWKLKLCCCRNQERQRGDDCQHDDGDTWLETGTGHGHPPAVWRTQETTSSSSCLRSPFQSLIYFPIIPTSTCYSRNAFSSYPSRSLHLYHDHQAVWSGLYPCLVNEVVNVSTTEL